MAENTHWAGKAPYVSEQTQRYIARLVCTGKLEGSRAVQTHLRSISGVKMTVHEIRKMLKGLGFKARKKVNTNFVSNTNMEARLRWAKKHRQLTVDQWRQLIFSDETRVNMWGSDGNSYFWSDDGDILRPHEINPKVQGDGGSVMFWGCITAEGSGYGTSIIEGTINSELYIDILGTSLADTLEYFGLDRKNVRFQQDNATPHTAALT